MFLTDFFWVGRHECDWFFDHFVNSDHTHSMWTYSSNWHTQHLSSIFDCTHAVFKEWHFGRQDVEFVFHSSKQSDHHFQLCQCIPSLSVVCFFHDQSLSFCVSSHHTKEHLCRVANFDQTFCDTFYHRSVRRVTICSFDSKCYQEWCYSWEDFDGNSIAAGIVRHVDDSFDWVRRTLDTTVNFNDTDFLWSPCNTQCTWEQRQRNFQDFMRHCEFSNFHTKVTDFTSQCVDGTQDVEFPHHGRDTGSWWYFYTASVSVFFSSSLCRRSVFSLDWPERTLLLIRNKGFGSFTTF